MRLTLLPERVSVDMQPGRSLLESALMASVPLLHSCRGGSCGACRAHWVSGEVDFPQGPGLGLTADEQSAGQILLCRAHPRSDVVVDVRTLRPAAAVESRHLPCRIEQLELLSPDVLRLRLRLPAIEPFNWSAGQYVDLILPDGTRRAYSLAAPPGEDARLEIHVARVDGGRVSGTLFAMQAPGALLSVEGPFGGLELPAPTGTAPLLLVAGGTGYAPIRAMLRELAQGAWTRPTRLYFGVRRGADLYADQELRQFERDYPHFRYVPVSEDGAGPSAVRRGRVHAAVLDAEPDYAAADVVVAGPSALVAVMRQALLARGLPAERFYADAFG